MNNSEMYVGLDIGTTSIKVLVCENVKGQLKVVGVGVAPSAGMSRGVITDIDQTAQAISRAVSQAAEKANTSISNVVVGLPANYLQMKRAHGMITVGASGQSREISDDDVKNVASETMAQSIPPEREVIALLPQQYTVDGFDGIKDPRGMVGVRLELSAIMYTGPKTIIHNTKKAVEKAGLHIQDLVVDPIATGFDLLNDGEQDFGTVVIDLGGGQTTTSIIHDHQLKFTYVDPEGGRFITRDISTVLNTSYRHAEQLKRDHGYADSSQADPDLEISVDVVGQNDPGSCTEEYLAEIIQARVEQIFDRTKKRLDAIHTPDLPGGIILLGGVAALPGIKDLAEQVFDTNVKVYVPDQMGIRHPGYATALALAMYESRMSEVDTLVKQTILSDGLIQSPHVAAAANHNYQPQRQTQQPAQNKRPAGSRPRPKREQRPKRQRQSHAKKSGDSMSRVKKFFNNFFE